VPRDDHKSFLVTSLATSRVRVEHNGPLPRRCRRGRLCPTSTTRRHSLPPRGMTCKRARDGTLITGWVFGSHVASCLADRRPGTLLKQEWSGGGTCASRNGQCRSCGRAPRFPSPCPPRPTDWRTGQRRQARMHPEAIQDHARVVPPLRATGSVRHLA